MDSPVRGGGSNALAGVALAALSLGIAVGATSGGEERHGRPRDARTRPEAAPSAGGSTERAAAPSTGSPCASRSGS